jgi:hypothetical protein
MSLGVLRGVAGHLHDPGPVAQVKEEKRAVVAAPVDPAGKGDRLSGMLGAQLAAVDRLKHGALSRGAFIAKG